MFFQLLINNWFEKFLENIVDTHSEISKLRMEIAVLTEKLANQTSTAELKIPPEKENPVLYSRIYNYTNACLTEARYFFFIQNYNFFTIPSCISLGLIRTKQKISNIEVLKVSLVFPQGFSSVADFFVNSFIHRKQNKSGTIFHTASSISGFIVH